MLDVNFIFDNHIDKKRRKVSTTNLYGLELAEEFMKHYQATWTLKQPAHWQGFVDDKLAYEIKILPVRYETYFDPSTYKAFPVPNVFRDWTWEELPGDLDKEQPNG